MKRNLILLALIIFNLHFAQINILSKQIDSLVAVKRVQPFNGTILISQNGKMLYKKTVGWSDIPNKVALHNDSTFEIMSNSKQITTVLALLEVEKGNLDLNIPIKKYLPNINQPWTNVVTIHQLMNNTSGIVSEDTATIFKPGSAFRYSNANFILLGKIVEFATKKPYRQVANEFFQKLKMTHTSFYNKEDKNITKGHLYKGTDLRLVKESFINEDNLSADGIITTPEDLAKWNNLLHQGKILKPTTYQKMISYTITDQHDVFGKEKVGYGYTIRINDKGNIKYYGNTGLGDGFTSVNIYFPKSKISMVVFENQMNEDFDHSYQTEIDIKNLLLKNKIVQ